MSVHKSQNHIDQQPQIPQRLKVSQWVETASLVTACALFALSILALCQIGAFAHFNQATSFGYGCFACSSAIFLGELIYKMVQCCRSDRKMDSQSQSGAVANDSEKGPISFPELSPDSKKMESASGDASFQVPAKAQQTAVLNNAGNQTAHQPETRDSPILSAKDSKKMPESGDQSINASKKFGDSFEAIMSSNLEEYKIFSKDSNTFPLIRNELLPDFGIAVTDETMWQNWHVESWEDDNDDNNRKTHHLVGVYNDKSTQNFNEILDVFTDNFDKNSDTTWVGPFLQSCALDYNTCYTFISDNEVIMVQRNNFRSILVDKEGNFATGTEVAKFKTGEYLVIASEGLWNVAKNEDVHHAISVMAQNNRDHEDMARILVAAALEAGSQDSIAVFVAKL
jgi:hypothetical protein